MPSRKILTKSSTYAELLKTVSQELSDIDVFIKRRVAEGWWRVGKDIDEHLLAHKERADYGATLYERLAEDVDRDTSTLQRAVRFYRIYPIPADPQELSWEHYRSLITIKDDKARKRVEAKAIQEGWNSTRLREYLIAQKEAQAVSDGKPVPKLAFTRGKLNTYQVIKANKALAKRSPLVLDLGFRLQHPVPGDRGQENDQVEIVVKEGVVSGARKVETSLDELFTYQAYVEKIIDGDTLVTSFDFHLDASISQKLRLRGIDCLEIDTEEGKKAKHFVEARIKGCEFIIVKTYKDRTDKFDRYLADIFYGDGDPELVAREGTYLNQELLDAGLARIWKG